jgi:hypothetical protein
MPPFGTCFQSKVGSDYALQAAMHGIVRRAICRPRVTVVWPASRSLAPMRAPGCRYFISFGLGLHGRNGGNNDMEGAAARTLSVGRETRTSSREADVFRILSKPARVI